MTRPPHSEPDPSAREPHGTSRDGTPVDRIVSRLEATNAVREAALRAGRLLTRTSANAIRALHRGEDDRAASLLGQATKTLEDIREVTAANPAIHWAGHVQDAMKEFAEAAITAALLERRPIPDPESLRVEDAAYLNGLAEAASELRRSCLDGLRRGDTDTAVRLLESMDAIYADLVTVDFPDAVTGGLRRTTDQLRAVLERTRGDVTMALRQDRLERAIRSVEASLQDVV